MERTTLLNRQPEINSYIPEAKLGYNIRFDQQDYRALTAQRDFLSPTEFQRRKDQLDLRTAHNLQTMLGERFTVEISKVQYHVVDRKLQNIDHDEPFIEIVKRGQQFREQNGSTDIAREKAEVTGFARAQELLADPMLDPEAKVIIISPVGSAGSIYKFNFFDTYSKDKNGQIIMFRVNSKLSYEQFRQVADQIDPFHSLPTNPTDADFLANPLVTYLKTEEIQQIMSPKEDTMPYKDYQKLLQACNFLTTTYVNLLANGATIEELAMVYNALLNYADRYPNVEELPQAEIISRYGAMPVRPVDGCCGVQTGAASARSVSEFGVFKCPKCQAEAIGPVGNMCPDCKITKEEYTLEIALGE